ncbi:hypothetical protein LJK88_34225 [Paenibacillus sp. P26]|nr:hypothetical protein LJK88_34225 [Paenibacillus sp. P26]
MQESHKIDGNEAKRDLDSQEMLCVIFDYAAKIANERKLDNQPLLLADMGRELVVSDRCSVWCSTVREASCIPGWRTVLLLSACR